MKFKSLSIPKETKGQGPFPPSITVPDQSLSLEEILQRFTRGEPIQAGHDTSYHESEDDLEKVSHMDLVDREEYVDKLKITQANYDKQEKRKAKAEKERLEKIALEEIKAEQQKKGASPDPAK